MIDEKELLSEIARTCPECYGLVAKAVSKTPTIEPKQGRWEMYGAITRGTLAIPIYRCSECKEETNNWFWHYCPNCGARMEVEE